jgi:hypothetical protein
VPPTLSLGDVGFKTDLGDSEDGCWGQSTAVSKVDEEMVGDGGTCPPYTRVGCQIEVCRVSARYGQTLLSKTDVSLSESTSNAIRIGLSICDCWV